ncbi:hypothetical protein N6B72_05005 [Chryseobacterium soli]|uniref:hypothetical protein n=1 Tax=Chryseobacterium soli TaxID=445961 RepID=UPI002952B871|nr:hypothetical protein [Chryseobacterium soli]MDV7696275.1 hypothetical protein [Chryseobacterium soli]
MPKNEQGQVICMNQNTTVNNMSIHHMEKIPGNGVLPKSSSGPEGEPIIDTTVGMPLDIYVCRNCMYTEFYLKPAGH